MTPGAAAILSDPQPCGHIVYPYTDEAQLASVVCLFIGAGLRKGESALLIMTESNCRAVLSKLKDDGFDVDALKASDRLICKDAEGLLSSFMFDGIIDEHLCKTKIGGLIEKAKQASGEHTVRVFGEMVNLIWRVRPGATERLEELWNQMIESHSVPLLCAYALTGSKPDALPDALMACHSHAIA
jgi:hypothetical protein